MRFREQFYDKFYRLVLKISILDDDIERLVNVLYFNEDHQQVRHLYCAKLL